MLDEHHGQDAEPDIDAAEEPGDDEFRPLPVEPLCTFRDGIGRLVDEGVFEIEVVAAETFPLLLLSHSVSVGVGTRSNAGNHLHGEHNRLPPARARREAGTVQPCLRKWAGNRAFAASDGCHSGISAFELHGRCGVV